MIFKVLSLGLRLAMNAAYKHRRYLRSWGYVHLMRAINHAPTKAYEYKSPNPRLLELDETIHLLESLEVLLKLPAGQRLVEQFIAQGREILANPDNVPVAKSFPQVWNDYHATLVPGKVVKALVKDLDNVAVAAKEVNGKVTVLFAMISKDHVSTQLALKLVDQVLTHIKRT